MRQKFWKELKSRLCPRESWVRDCDSPKCQCCGKQFSFFRRRHHCRFCGKVFCAHCSGLFINGTYLGLSEKYVRHCEFCKQQIEKIKKDLNRLMYMVQEEQDFARSQEDDNESSSSDEDDEYFSVRVIFGSNEKESQVRFAQQLEAETKAVGKRMLARLIQMGSVPQEYQNGRLLQMLLRGVVECRMDILPRDLNTRSSYMDITRHLAIKTLQGLPAQHLELVCGAVLEKSLPVKHMLNRLVKPQIIAIENSLDQSGVKVRFQDLISNENAIFQQLEQRIMKFNPDIVLVERTTSRQLLNFFAEKGITVISGLKKKELQRIVQVAGIRSTIKNIWAIQKYKPNHLVGSLDLMHLRNFQHNPDPIIYFQKNIGTYSLIVSERNHDSQIALKRALQTLLRLLRQVNLEKYLVYLDFQMWEERQCKNAPRLSRINPYYLDYLERTRYEELQFYRLRLSELKLQKEDKKLRQYCKSKGRKLFLDPCGEGTHEQIVPYSEQDNTIGHFLLVVATGFLKKCSECRLQHRQRFYFGNSGISLTVSKLKDEEREELQDEEDFNKEQLHKYLKKYKQNWDIFSYFQCKACGVMVSKKGKVGKNYLKNSFYYFLYLVANSDEVNDKKSPRMMPNSNSNQSPMKQCLHPVLQRVLQTSDIRFGMQVFSVDHFQISLIDLRAEEYQIIYRQSLRKYIIELANSQVEQKHSLLDTLSNIVDSYICLLQPFRFQDPVESRLIIELEKLETLRDILLKMRAHVEEVWGREKGKEYSHTTDWTYLGRQMAKVDFALKSIIDILRVIQGVLHKRKKKIQENEMMSVYTNEEVDSLLDFDPRQGRNSRDGRASVHQRNSREDLEDFDFRRVTSEETLPMLERERSGDDRDDRSEKYSIKSLTRKVSQQSAMAFNLVYNQPRLRAYSQEMRRRRYQLKKGQYLYFNLVNYKKALSVLVCALNSVDFKEQMEKRPSDAFRFNLILSKDIPTSWDLKQRIDKIKGEGVEDEADNRDSYQIIAYYHKQFQILRETEGISQDNYIKSLANSQFWETMGGKSNSEFAKSQDEILVIKSIKAEEFEEFLKFASDYLQHVKVVNRNSFLTKIYGIYDIAIKGDNYKCVVMQNLFLGFEGLSFRKYDLKGSEVNRLFLPKTPQQSTTGLDTNFKIDKNYHPYFIQEKSYQRFINALNEDVHFLCKNEVIDYSLLVIQHGHKLRMGIIDFMRPYHLMERIQNKYKELTNKNEPTVIPPQQYADRFLKAMQNYFAYHK